MGDWFQNIVDAEATEADASGLGEQVVAWLIADGIITAERTDCVLGAVFGHGPGPECLRATEAPVPSQWTNGLSVQTGHQEFTAGQGAFPDGMVCPGCGAGNQLAIHNRDDVVWVYSESGARSCVRCGDPSDFNDWTWTWPEHSSVWAHLGLTFWNWPPLRPEFIAELGQRLGHRTVYQEGKL